MRRPAHSGKKGSRSALIFAVLLALVAGGLLFLLFWERAQLRREAADAAPDVYEAQERRTVSYKGTQYALREDLETFLIMGLDKFEENKTDPDAITNNQQSDFLLLMLLDEKAGTYTAVHINRDTMAEIQRLGLGGKKLGSFTGQLALSHTYGSGGKDSCRNTVQAVSRYLYDVPIDHYFSLTMDAIPLLNDLAGGVTVHIEDDFSAVDPKLEQGKDVRLQGQQALSFVRARMSMADGSNLSRMNRQRTYINALYEQLAAKLRANDNFAAKLAANLADYTVSDLVTSELSDLAERIRDCRFLGIETIPGEAVMGEEFMEFYADEDALQALVIRLFFEPVKN